MCCSYGLWNTPRTSRHMQSYIFIYRYKMKKQLRTIDGSNENGSCIELYIKRVFLFFAFAFNFSVFCLLRNIVFFQNTPKCHIKIRACVLMWNDVFSIFIYQNSVTFKISWKSTCVLCFVHFVNILTLEIEYIYISISCLYFCFCCTNNLESIHNK